MFWPHGQPSMRGDPLNGGFPGTIYAEIVDRAVRPHDLYAPDLANLHRQQDRGQTFGWFILWRHRQDKQIRPLKLRTARLASCRAVPPRIRAPVARTIPRWTGLGSNSVRRDLAFWGQKPVSTGHRPIRTWPSSIVARRKLTGPLAVIL